MAAFKKPNTDVKNYLEKPGQYHCAVTHIEENPIYEGVMKDQVNIGVVVLAGTEPSQVRREMTLKLSNPNEGNKDGGEFLARVQCRAAAAMGAMAIITNPDGSRVYSKIEDVPDDAEMEIDWVGNAHRDDPQNVSPWVVGKQFILKTKEEEYQGRKSIKHDGAHIYFVENTKVASVPKDAAALKQGGYKLVSAQPAAPVAPTGAAGGPKGKPAATTKAPAPKPAAAAAGAYDDL